MKYMQNQRRNFIKIEIKETKFNSIKLNENKIELNLIFTETAMRNKGCGYDFVDRLKGNGTCVCT